jgi:hypothetical protein
MAKIKSRYLLLPIFALMILYGCSMFRFVNPQPSPPEPTPPPPEWLTDWLTDPVCQPPCWQGITPGVTTMTETVEILQGLPWVYIDFGPDRPLPNKGHITIEWSFYPPSSGGGMALAFDDERIKTLEVGGVLSTQLQKVIESYGPPSHVYLPSCMDGKCQTRLIYLTTGMAVELFLDWDRDAEGDVTVTPDSEVRGIEFFTPGEKGYITAYPQFSESFPKWSSPWVGYSKYLFR